MKYGTHTGVFAPEVKECLELEKVRAGFEPVGESPAVEGYFLGSWNGFAVLAVTFEELVRFYDIVNAVFVSEAGEDGEPLESYKVEVESDGTRVLWATGCSPWTERTELVPALWADGVPLYSTGSGWALCVVEEVAK